MADWYYAQGGQQLGPVADVQLQQLAASGQLRPADLVWAEGMPSWAAAGTIPNLFPPAPSHVIAPAGQYSPGAVAYPDEPYAERPRRRQAASGGLSTGAIFGIVGGVVGLIILVVVVIVVAVGSSSGGANSWTLTLMQGQRDVRNVRFNAGAAWVEVTTDPGHPQLDVDLFVFDSAGRPVAQDIGLSRNARVDFLVPHADTYRVEVVNLGPGMARSRVRHN
jgi:hypothetical protein